MNNYGLLKENIKNGANLPENFKKNSEVLLDFINSGVDVCDFDVEAWTDDIVDVYLDKMLDIYRLSGRPFKVPKGLYDNHKVFIFLLERGLLTLDPLYRYGLELSIDDIEKYVGFLKENRTFIIHQYNFIKSSLLLKRVLEEGLINYIYSFDDEAWTLENIELFCELLKKGELVIPNSLVSNPKVLEVSIKSFRNLDKFLDEAWDDENIKLFVSLYDTKDIPDYLYSSPLFLNYYLSGSDFHDLCFFRDEAWDEVNTEIFKQRVLINPVSLSEFPLSFMFNSEILTFVLENSLDEYLDLFMAKAWTDDNIELYENLLINGGINYIPGTLRDSASILSFCLDNNLMGGVSSFVSKAWDVNNSKKYILSFEDGNFEISEGMKKSTSFAIAIIMFGYYDKILDFPLSSTPDEYVDILFENVIADRAKYELVSSKYKEVDEKIKLNFRNYIVRNNGSVEDIDDIVYVFLNINYSNSSELKNVSNEIADLVLSHSNPREEFKRIERIFLSDELPNVAKVYSVFRMFHSDSSGKLWLNVYENISPVLKRYSSLDLKRRSIMCEVIIFSDLIKAFVESNNMEFRRYLRDLKKGDEIFNRMSSLNGDLDERETILLKSYLRKLTALYNQTLAGKKNNYVLQGDISLDVNNLVSLFKVDGGSEKLLDRVIQMYMHFIGIETYDDLVKHVNGKVELADRRGRENERKPFILEPGDFIKGINEIKYLPNILNNGSLAKEFLGSAALKDGDSTPLDTDGCIIRERMDINGLFGGNYLAFDYGNTWVVVKKDKLHMTRDINGEVDKPEWDRDKLEVFQANLFNDDHYGIRTGFPSTDIDYIITREYSKSMGFEIARSGFYIPVLDTSSNVVFTSEMYDNIRKQMNGLSYYGFDTFEFSDNLDFLDLDNELKELENSQSEVLVKEHMIRETIDGVLSKFNLRGIDKLDGNLSRNIYNFVDIGSTGRGTHSNNADFDFMLLLDQSIVNNESKMKEIVTAIREALNDDMSTELNFLNDIRLKNVCLNGVYMDIDITFEGKTDSISYSSDMALMDRIDVMEKTSKEKALLVKANIIKAKKILKEAGAYKPQLSSEMQGGLGGAGVENWILANGGSLIDASISFLEAYDRAYELSETKDDHSVFFEFSNLYSIWNFGENFYSLRTALDSLHNEFVTSNMSSVGLKKMALALKKYLKELDIDYNKVNIK